MSEVTCTLVSTRGIAKSCTQCPLWNPNGSIEYSLSYDNRPGDTIYLMFDWVEPFIQHHLNHMRHPFILVSGNSDHTTPSDFPSASKLLEHPHCIAWFSQNCISIDHPKLKHIPIGLDYHTLSFSRGQHEWGRSGVTPLQQELELVQVANSLRPLQQTRPLAVTNFHLAMDTPPRRFFYRAPAYQALQKSPCVRWLPSQPRLEFWKSCDEYAYVVCPFGNGLDTHRTWEVLALGRIPIIKASPLNIIFEKLPVLEIQDWHLLTPEFLSTQYHLILQRIQRDEYDLTRLHLRYWVERIQSAYNKTVAV